MVEKKIPEINGKFLKDTRIAKGVESNELANTLCLSNKHILQIENGGNSAFYSDIHKVQVARKIGKYFGLTEDQYLVGFSAQANEDNIDENDQVDLVKTNVGVSTSKVSTQTMCVEKLNKKQLKSHKKQSFLPVFLAVIAIVGFASYQFAPSSFLSVVFNQLDSDSNSNIVVPEPKVKSETVKADETKVEDIKVNLPNDIVGSTNSVCDIVPQQVLPFKAYKANSVGNFLYFVSKADQSICVIDASNKKQLVEVKAGENRNFVGQQPFTVISPDFSKLEIYYQGWKVPFQKDVNTVRTEEQFNKKEPTALSEQNPIEK